MRNQKGLILVMSFLPLLLSIVVGGAVLLAALQIRQKHQWLCRQTVLAVARSLLEGKPGEVDNHLQKLHDDFAAIGSSMTSHRKTGENIVIDWRTADHLGYALQGNCSYDFRDEAFK